MTEPIWSPSPERIRQAKMTEFIRFVAARWDRAVVDYDTLYSFSITQVECFWDALWQFLHIIGEKGQDIVINPDAMPGAKWFPQARLNFAENHLRRRNDEVAIIARTESGARRSMSWRELYDAVSRCRQALIACGVEPRDRVIACLPNVPEAVVALLATTSIGAIWSCCSPEYGEQSLLDRMGQIEAKILIVADGYRYGGKQFETHAKTEAVAREIPSLKRVVTVPFVGLAQPLPACPNAVSWDTFLAPFPAETIKFERFPFDHPLYVLYSSGTTGKPKAIVHCAGGCLLQGLKAIVLHSDVSHGDRTFYHTNTGWVVWNHMLSALAWESPIVLYDGSPTYPTLQALFDVVSAEQVNHLRIAPPLIEAYAKAGLHPARSHDLQSLKSIMAGSARCCPTTTSTFIPGSRRTYFCSPPPAAPTAWDRW